MAQNDRATNRALRSWTIAVGIGIGYLNSTVLGLSALENMAVMAIFVFFGLLQDTAGIDTRST